MLSQIRNTSCNEKNKLLIEEWIAIIELDPQSALFGVPVNIPYPLFILLIFKDLRHWPALTEATFVWKQKLDAINVISPLYESGIFHSFVPLKLLQHNIGKIWQVAFQSF